MRNVNGARNVGGPRNTGGAKEARSQRFVMAADGKDTSQEIRAARHVIRPV